MKKQVLAAMAAIALSIPTLVSMPSQSQAQEYRYMSCSRLWHARNAIYARKGYCFKTERARRVFGRNCFPPYGRLSPREAREVQRIESWEFRKGCR